VNGRGTCLTTEQCLLNPNRNPKLSRKKIERYLSDYLGIQKVIWLKEGIEGDDTDGHVDDMARFVDPNTVVAAMESDPEDKNHAILKENLRILKSATDAKSRRLKVIELPMPGRVGRGRPDTGHSRLPASYANFYIANGCVLLPLYSHSNDKKALGLFKKVFPGRKIVGIECSALVYGLGSIHCVTQQEPVAQV
jgi:agmatine deiminase